MIRAFIRAYYLVVLCNSVAIEVIYVVPGLTVRNLHASEKNIARCQVFFSTCTRATLRLHTGPPVLPVRTLATEVWTRRSRLSQQIYSKNMVLYNTNYCCYNQNKFFLADSIMKTATAIPKWVVGRGDNHHHPHKKRSQHTPPSSSSVSKASSSSSTSNDFFVLMMVLLLLLTCIISTIILSKIIAITSSTRGNVDVQYSKSPRTKTFLDTFSIPQYYKSNHVAEDNKGQAPFSSFLRRNHQQQQRRRLYEFVTPNIRECSASGLLDTCPYVMAGSNSTGGDDILFDGTCPSNLQQMITDNWCYNGEKEVCCGLSSDDCCGLAKSYLALFFLLAMVALSPIFILIICAYGRCCICYPKLWNAKSNRGCGTPRPSSNDNNEKSTSVQVVLPETAAVDVGVSPTDDMVAVNDEEEPVSK